MRKITGKVTAGLLALMMAVSGVPAAGNALIGQKIVRAADEDQQQTIAKGTYNVPVKSLESAAPLPPVQEAFAKAFGEKVKVIVDEDGNQTATIDLQHMVVDMSAFGMEKYDANVLTVENAKVLATKEQTWSDPNGDFSQPAVQKTHEVPTQIEVPLTAGESGSYKISITVDFMDGLLGGGDSYPTTVTLTLDWENAERIASEGAFLVGKGAAQTEVTPGTYSTTVKLQKDGTDIDAENYLDDSKTSMAGSCINGPATIVIHKDGTATMTLGLRAVSAFGLTGWASDWKIVSGSGDTAARIDEAFEGNPTKISFKIPDITVNGVYATMYIDVMKTTQKAIFAIDWKNIKKTSDDTSDSSNVEGEYNEIGAQISSVLADVKGLKESDYTADSWKVLTEAVEAAQKAVDDQVSMGDLQKALDVLKQAKENLKKEEKPADAVTTKVDTPTNVKAASAAYNKVKISWKKVSGATGYEVYQYNSKTKKYAKIATVKGTSYTKTGLKTGTKYIYKVRAYKTSGGKTVYSVYAKAVSAKPVPAKVTKVKAVNKSKKSAKITWKKVSGASGYRVYRATKKNGKYKLVKTIKKNKTVKYTNKKLKKGKKYYYKVRAYKNVGKKKVFGKYSSIVKVTVKK